MFKSVQKPVLIYVVVLLLLAAFLFHSVEFTVPLFLSFLIFGIFAISYYARRPDKIHRVAFIILMLFGTVCLFVTPITDVSDEVEHFTRSEIVSTGQIGTEYVQIPQNESYGYQTIKSVYDLAESDGLNVFITEVDNQKIDYSQAYLDSAFSQNPFFAYLAQAFGIFLAKLLDLNAIWMLWLGRFFNLLLYSLVSAYAVKKAPAYKVPLLLVAILPMSIYMAASFSTDAFFNCFGLLAFAYFIYMYKSPEKSVENLDILLFFISVLLCGILKAPFLALGLLILLVPNASFKDSRQSLISKFGIAVLLAIGLLWNFGFATNQLNYSWRGPYYEFANVSASGQISYLIDNPAFALNRFLETFTALPYNFERLFYYSNGQHGFTFPVIGYVYMAFFMVYSLLYPVKDKIKFNDRVKAFSIALMIYLGVYLVQYLTWAPVGFDNITNGVFGRYFIPLLAFLPFILGIGNKKIDTKYILAISMLFIAAFVMYNFLIRY